MQAQSLNEQPSLADLRKQPHLSYSAIRSYLMCPMKFWHRYQAQSEPSHRPLALVLGSAIHESLAAYYSHIQGTGMKICADELMQVFRDTIDAELDKPIPIKLPDDGDPGAMLDQGVQMLRVFWEQADVPEVIAVEQPFAVPLYDPASGEQFSAPIVGAMDLVINHNGRPLIVEHKTSSRKYAGWQLALETQPSVYKYAAQQLGLGDAGLMYQILLKAKSPSVQHCRVKRTPAQITEMLETFSAIVKTIDAGHFWKNRSWACSDCQYSWLCDGDGS